MDEKKIIRLTGMHSLKSERDYDYSRNIDETTHVVFRWAEYERVDGKLEYTDRWWIAIVPLDELFTAFPPEEYNDAEV